MNLPKLMRLLAMIALAACSLLNTACSAATPGTGPNASVDLLNGVCLNYGDSRVCYNPLTKQWTVNEAAVKAVYAADGTVTLTDAAGNVLVYKNGKITGPADSRGPPAATPPK